jgi:Tfp pilus assembly protein PilF
MADVFISYSHANIDFARRLAVELRKAKKDIWIDLDGIRFTSDWWEEIRRGIESSDNFLLIMSPSSLGSPVCHLEIETARELKKRIILINHQTVDRSSAAKGMHERLGGENSEYVNALIGNRNPSDIFDANWYILEKYQHVSFGHNSEKNNMLSKAEEDRFLQQYTQLQEALNTDMAHVRLHTRFGLLLRDWETSEQNKSFLLFGDELHEAENWLVEYQADKEKRQQKGDSPKIPEPTEAQIRYIQESRAEEDARQARLKALEDARRESEAAAKKAEAASLRSEAASKSAQRVLSLVTILAIVILGGTAFFTNQQVTEAQNNVGTATNEVGIAIARQEEAVGLVATATREYATAIAARSTAAEREQNALNQVATSTQALGTIEANLDNASTREAIALTAVADAHMTLTPISATVTQAAVLQDIYMTFGYAMIAGLDSYDFETLDWMLERYPNEPAAYIMHGQAYIEVGDYNVVIRDFTQALDADPENFGAYMSRGIAYYNTGENDAAIDDFSRALEIAPDYWSYDWRGFVLSDSGQYEEAIDDFTHAIELAPDYAQAYRNRGFAYYYMEDYEASVADFSRSLELEPDTAYAYVGRGNAYYYLENYTKAIDDYTQAIALEPDNAYAYYSRGWAYYILSDNENCISDFNRAEVLGFIVSPEEKSMCD